MGSVIIRWFAWREGIGTEAVVRIGLLLSASIMDVQLEDGLGDTDSSLMVLVLLRLD